MKTIYIPKGETVCYDQLATERIVVRGCLKVLGSPRFFSSTRPDILS